MIIQQKGAFLLGKLNHGKLSEKDRRELLAMGNEEIEDELLELLDEADMAADPLVLFGVCPVTGSGQVGGIHTGSDLVADKLRGKSRVFPYIVTCGPKLENWSRQYQSDFLLSFWADEIKKRFLTDMSKSFHAHLKNHYHTAGHLAALNPGSLPGWPISGQEALFEMLGGRTFVEEAIGVTYSDSYLMHPTKTISGIAFESDVFYENCQYCPLANCPNRRARRLTEEE